MSFNTLTVIHDYESLKEKVRNEILSLPGIELIPLNHTIMNPDADWLNGLIMGSQVIKVTKNGDIHCKEMDGQPSIFELIHVEFIDLMSIYGQLSAFDLKYDLNELAWIKDQNRLGFVTDIKPHDQFYFIKDKAYRYYELVPVRLKSQLDQFLKDGASYDPSELDQINQYF